MPKVLSFATRLPAHGVSWKRRSRKIFQLCLKRFASGKSGTFFPTKTENKLRFRLCGKKRCFHKSIYNNCLRLLYIRIGIIFVPFL